MSLKSVTDKIDSLQHQIDSYGRLSEEVLKRIQYRFRLDWNYHSNAMEGSTLTIQETRSVMIDNVDVGGRPLKDINEMRGHDNVVKDIFRIGKGELRLTEKRIKEIHKSIIYETDPSKIEQIGKWKTNNNTIINYKKEKFIFTEPHEVPEQMHRLLDWLNVEKEKIERGSKDSMAPVLIAGEFHLRFVSIHPFYDGNGRTARLLMNLILVSLGYPPIVVKLSDKETYGKYLADVQAYGGDPTLFYQFMCELMIRSQQLVLDAIAGKDISEESDLDKKIELLKAEIAEVDKDNEVQLRFDRDIFIGIFDTWLSQLLMRLIDQIRKLDDLFADPSHYIGFKTGEHHGVGGENYVVKFDNRPAEEIISNLRTWILNKSHHVSADTEVEVHAFYGTFKKGALIWPFGCAYSVRISFEYLKYEIYRPKYYPGQSFLITNEVKQNLTANKNYEYLLVNEEGGFYFSSAKINEDSAEFKEGKYIAQFSRDEILNGTVKDRAMFRYKDPRLLHKPLTEQEIKEITVQFGNVLFDHIDYCTKKQGIR